MDFFNKLTLQMKKRRYNLRRIYLYKKGKNENPFIKTNKFLEGG